MVFGLVSQIPQLFSWSYKKIRVHVAPVSVHVYPPI